MQTIEREQDRKPSIEDQLDSELEVPARLPGETAEAWAERINAANGYEPGGLRRTPAPGVDGVKPFQPDEWDHVRQPYGD